MDIKQTALARYATLNPFSSCDACQQADTTLWTRSHLFKRLDVPPEWGSLQAPAKRGQAFRRWGNRVGRRPLLEEKSVAARGRVQCYGSNKCRSQLAFANMILSLTLLYSIKFMRFFLLFFRFLFTVLLILNCLLCWHSG
jgi:hypothetical protein